MIALVCLAFPLKLGSAAPTLMATVGMITSTNSLKMFCFGRMLTVMDTLTKPVQNSRMIVLKSLALRRLTEGVASTVMPMVGRTNQMLIQWILLDT